MKKFLFLAFLMGSNVYAGSPNNMICTEKSLAGHDFKYTEKNIAVTYKSSVDFGGQIIKIFNLRYLDGNLNYDITNFYFSRNTAYWVEPNFHNSQYFNSQCGSHLQDSADYHFLVAGGDFGPVMCLSCYIQ